MRPWYIEMTGASAALTEEWAAALLSLIESYDGATLLEDGRVAARFTAYAESAAVAARMALALWFAQQPTVQLETLRIYQVPPAF